MTAPAAIEAQLVDMRNVGTHKVLKLTIHVPEEQALAAIAAFGWPTGVNPVRIAIAHLVDEKEVVPPATSKPTTETQPRQKETAGGAKQAFRDMRLPNQAGMLCAEVPFQKFILNRYGSNQLHTLKSNGSDNWQFDTTVAYVRKYCGVTSRSDIRPRTPSGDRWTRLVEEYRTWMHAPELAS